MAKDKTDLIITLTGKLAGVDIDDVERVKKMGRDDIITALLRDGKEIKLDVREVYIKGGKKE